MNARADSREARSTPGRPATGLRLALAAALVALPGWASAAPAAEGGGGILHELDRAMVRLAERVSPSVVQVQVEGFRSAEPTGRAESALVARQHVIGSGVIVDPAGFIITNNHVVKGAQRVQVLLPGGAGNRPGADDVGRRLFDAKVVGTEPNADLALLKIDASGLRALPLDGAAPVRQGELVFAIGSPEGLERTVTMGIVGSAAREVEMEQHMEFIQTDAPINPGNSGGPLVNSDGELVGINTFLVTESGGSQGLGFAIPASMVKLVYEGLRRDGRVHLLEAGLSLQAIDRSLALGLGLPRDWGVVVADVELESPARAAGVQPGDVVVEIDGRPIANLAAVTTARYLHHAADPVRLVLLRGTQRLTMKIEAKEKRRPGDLAELADPGKNLVRRIGIVGLDVGPDLRGRIPPLLVGSGVVVAARTLDATALETGLRPGDVIHSVNRTEITTVEGLRTALRDLKQGDAVAMQIEREGKLAYLSFEME